MHICKNINSATKITKKITNKVWPGRKILVVEDDEFSFEFIRVSLRDRGLEILHAVDGGEALKIYDEITGIDLILLDIQIPVIDGYMVCRRIREKDPLVPIIAQTAFALNDEKTRCEEAGCNAYLSKPLDVNKLMDLLDQFLS